MIRDMFMYVLPRGRFQDEDDEEDEEDEEDEDWKRINWKRKNVGYKNISWSVEYTFRFLYDIEWWMIATTTKKYGYQTKRSSR